MSEGAFAVLAWQLLFVVGSAVGWHRDALSRALRGSAGRGIVAFCFALAALFIVHRFSGVAFLEPHTDSLADRRFMAPIRLVNVFAALVSLYVVLAWLGPMAQVVRLTLGRVGENTLYVFVVHVFILIVVATVFGVDAKPFGGLSVITQAATLLLLWLMVRQRVLFSVIPR